MQQTPLHDYHNPDLLRLIPIHAKNIIEIGCSSGALAREYKKINPDSHYIGVDIDENYVEVAKRYCDQVQAKNIDGAADTWFAELRDRDCWIFGDTLEHLREPWVVLKEIRKVIPANGCLVACIPNAQHWSILARLAVGEFRYEDSGLLDRTHLRWFTRQTIIELFNDSDFTIAEGLPRIFDEPQRDQILPLIGNLAEAVRGHRETALQDCLALQYVIRAIPT